MATAGTQPLSQHKVSVPAPVLVQPKAAAAGLRARGQSKFGLFGILDDQSGYVTDSDGEEKKSAAIKDKPQATTLSANSKGGAPSLVVTKIVPAPATVKQSTAQLTSTAGNAEMADDLPTGATSKSTNTPVTKTSAAIKTNAFKRTFPTAAPAPAGGKGTRTRAQSAAHYDDMPGLLSDSDNEDETMRRLAPSVTIPKVPAAAAATYVQASVAVASTAPSPAPLKKVQAAGATKAPASRPVSEDNEKEVPPPLSGLEEEQDFGVVGEAKKATVELTGAGSAAPTACFCPLGCISSEACPDCSLLQNGMSMTKGEDIKAVGNIFYSRGNNAWALKLYTRAIEVDAVNSDSPNPAFFFNRAAAHNMAKNHKEAVQDARTAAEVAYDNPKYWLRYVAYLQNVPCRLEQLQGPVECAATRSKSQDAAVMMQNFKEATVAMAALERTRNGEKHIEYLSRVHKLFPNLSQVTMLLAQAHMEQGHINRAAQLATDARHIDPDCQQSRYIIGCHDVMTSENALVGLKMLETLLDEGFEKARSWVDAYKLPYSFYDGDGCFDPEGIKAALIASTEDLMSRLPEGSVRVPLLLQRAEAYVGMGSKLKARVDFSTVLQINSWHPEALIRRAELSFEFELFEEAIADVTRATTHKLKTVADRAKILLQKFTTAKKEAAEVNYYQRLSVDRCAELQEIKKAYKRESLKWHPDRHDNEDAKFLADIKFKQISEAYATLKDEETRQKYHNCLVSRLPLHASFSVYL